MRAPSLLFVLTGLWLVWARSVIAQPDSSLPAAATVLTNASAIRSLNPVEAAKSLPVCLTGVVMDVPAAAPNPPAIILADPTAEIYVAAARNIFTNLHRGDAVEIKGATDPGHFAPIVMAATIRKLGAGTIPAARPVTYQQLITGALDAQWVEIKGVVRQCYPISPGSDVRRIIVALDGGLVSVRFNTQPLGQIQTDAEVRVRAVCFYQFNQKRQVLLPVLQVPRDVPVIVEKRAPADPYAAPIRSGSSLLMFTPENLFAYAHRIHVNGVVIYSQPGSFVWIRDGASGLRIQTRQEEDLAPGDNIDILGFPTFGSYSPMLEDSSFCKTASTPPPSPLFLTNFDAAFEHEDDLVAMEGMLTQIQPVLDGLAFTLDKDGKTFRAVLKLSADGLPHPGWEAGSFVRITGICSLVHDEDRPFAGVWQPKSFQILVRTPADITMIKPPRWWNLKHITMALSVVTGLLVLVISLVVVLSRRRLREQERQREMSEAELVAILSERNRLAREIHDTLAQGLAATSVQLRLAKKSANGTSGDVCQHIDAAQLLVRGSLEEARSSIWNMRSHVLETGDLGSALGGILKQMSDGREIETQFDVVGRVRRFAPVIENNILRVGQEAISNAVKHSAARHIQVKLKFGERQFVLEVTDDGRGFDPQAPPSSDGGFGLTGMRERAAELKGELTTRSTPGGGAEIILNIPLSGD